jgi:hypothetical protein
LVVLVVVPGWARADVLNFQMSSNFSGTMPTGPTPWVNVSFADVTPGTVLLTVSNVDITPGEKVSELYLNLNPNLAPTSLVFANLGGSPGVTAPLPSLGVNAFKADGDGKYDILFQFSQPPTNSFTAGDYLSYQITGIPTLRAVDFEYLSAPAGGHGPFDAAAHVQGIAATDIIDTTATSGWIAPGPSDVVVVAVPEPRLGTFFLLGAALAGGRRIWLSRARRS